MGEVLVHYYSCCLAHLTWARELAGKSQMMGVLKGGHKMVEGRGQTGTMKMNGIRISPPFSSSTPCLHQMMTSKRNWCPSSTLPGAWRSWRQRLGQGREGLRSCGPAASHRWGRWADQWKHAWAAWKHYTSASCPNISMAAASFHVLSLPKSPLGLIVTQNYTRERKPLGNTQP